MKQLLEGLIENNQFSNMVVECPECGCMEDEQYHCTTCEEVRSYEGSIKVEDLINRLKEELYK